MRIVCEECSAAYAIEDRLVGPAGVRAQCPKCRHQQLVTRAAPPPEPSTARAASPAVEKRCTGCGTPLTDAFDQALGTCDKCRTGAAAEAKPGFQSLLASAELELDTSAPPAAAPPPPARRPKPADPFAAIDQAAADAGIAEAPPDLDPFDFGAPAPAAPSDLSAAPTIFDDVAALPAEPSPTVKVAPDAARPPTPARPARPMAPQAGISTEIISRSAPLKLVQSKGTSGKLIAAAIGGLILAVVLALVLFPKLRPRLALRPDPVPDVVSAVVPRWRMLFVDIPGTAQEMLQAGDRQLSLDEPLAYGEAEESYQQALIQDPRSDHAIAGYVEAAALGRRDELDPDAYAEAEQLIAAAEQRSNRSAETLIAHAHLLLSGAADPTAAPARVAQARSLAEEALAKAADDPARAADAHLALGRAYLPTSAALALQHFDLALGAPQPPLAAWSYRALAYEAQGEYRKAIDDLRRRLELTPGQADALEALARIYQECGDTDDARLAYAKARERHPEDLRFAVLHLAFAYQVDGDVRLAAAGLRTLLADADRYDARVAALGLTHLATVERLLGNAGASEGAARAALQYRPDAAGAQLQLFLNALDRRELAAAHAALDKLQGHSGNPALEEVLAARLAFAENAPLIAAEACRRAYALDPRRTDALLCAGFGLVSGGRPDEGHRLLHQAAQADPLRTAPRPVVTRLYVRDSELLGSLAGLLARTPTATDDVRAALAEGVLRFHLHKLDEADAYLLAARALDESNPLVRAYRALVLLARKQPAPALAEADRGAATGKQYAIVRYAQGAALAATGARDRAERTLSEAVEAAPGFLASEVLLAELQANRGQKDAARERLHRAIARDPGYLPAKRTLYALQGGGVP